MRRSSALFFFFFWRQRLEDNHAVRVVAVGSAWHWTFPLCCSVGSSRLEAFEASGPNGILNALTRIAATAP